jgi:hypothetical protein
MSALMRFSPSLLLLTAPYAASEITRKVIIFLSTRVDQRIPAAWFKIASAPTQSQPLRFLARGSQSVLQKIPLKPSLPLSLEIR